MSGLSSGVGRGGSGLQPEDMRGWAGDAEQCDPVRLAVSGFSLFSFASSSAILLRLLCPN